MSSDGKATLSESDRTNARPLPAGRCQRIRQSLSHPLESGFRFSRLYLKNDEDAEDVVQEVFIRLWQIHERIHPDGNFSGLLFIITRNLIFNRFHKQIDPLSFKVSVLAALESSDDIESEVSARDLAEYIDRLIDLMPARQRQVFNMSRREHKSYREIAEELNLSQKTVEAHMHEALRFLRDNLALLLWLALFNDGPVC